MDKQIDNYNILIDKLDRFIRRYYINKIIRGSIYLISLIIVLFLVFSLLESQFYFNKAIRKSIYYGFIITSIAGLGYWIVYPLTKYFQLGKTISREKAATIIGDHFSNVQDKLLNVLQLYNQVKIQNDNQLLFAGIDQKSEKIKLVPFKSAINFKKNKKYLKYLIPPALILLLIFLISPGTIESSTSRIIQNDKDFEQPAPFHFKILNDKLEIVQYEDVDLLVEVTGEYIPSDVYIDINDFQYRLQKTGDKFVYHFKNVQKPVDFHIFSGKVNSREYTLEVIPKPLITEFSIFADYPAYTGQKDDIFENTGDIVVPEGTKLKWDFQAINTDSLSLFFNSNKKLYHAKRRSKNTYVFDKKVREDELYKIFILNKRIQRPDSVSYSINVIKDKFPVINMEQFKDSLDNSVFYFVGDASDDYGILSVTFNVSVYNKNDRKINFKKTKIDIDRSNNVSFRHFFDISELGLKPSEYIKYYFETFDNDGVNGPKSARTGMLEYRKPSEEEFEKKENENEEDIKDNLEKILKESAKIRDKLKRLREKLLQKKNPEWQDKKELEKLLKKEAELKKMLEEAKKKLDENLKNQEEFKKENESILEKQEKIQKMFEESLSQEQKDLLEKIQEMMEDLQKDDMLDKMDEMNMDQEKVEKQMDRLLELFKQLEVEKELQESIDKLNELAEKQEKLSEETKKNPENKDELKKKQEELNKEFDKVKEKVSDLMKKNKELEVPKNLADDNEEKMEDIKEDMEKSKKEMEENNPQNASQSQKSAAQKMKSMAKSLEMQMEGSSKEQHEEDMKALRQLLENILTLSFDQENLMDNTDGVIVNSPAFKKLLKEQYKVKEDFKIVEDSLQELSKRVVEIQTFVNEKVSEIKKSIKNSIDKLENDDQLPGRRDFPKINKFQHESMKGLNDLALMLDEAMQQMQKNASGTPGSGSCDKPGGSGKKPGEKGKSGNQPMDKIVQGQKNLTEKLKGMMKNGKSGKKGGMAREFAEAAKRQAELRKALEELQKQKQEEGKGAGNQLQKMIDEMNKIEEDLVNKKLDAKLIKRQQEITSRLLEADKADKKRGYDNQRKSKSAIDKEKKMPPAVEKYLKERESQLEFYKSISPDLKPFYKKLVDQYIKNLKKVQ